MRLYNRTKQDKPVRAAQIESVLDRVIAEQDSGVHTDFAAVEAAHPELMPELGEHLRRVRAVADAGRRFDGSDAVGRAFDIDSETPAENVAFLREALPQYEVFGQIHTGGQGAVFKALQRSTRREVAIKLLLDGPLATPLQQMRFAREAELASRLRHPNIVTVHDSGVVRGRPYLVMEFVEGLPIDDFVFLHRPPVRGQLELFQQVCQAVSFAHQRGVIHRDLKPANILVDRDGQPRVLDFGFAKEFTGTSTEPPVSVSGHVVGTLPYLSPEQAMGRSNHADVRSDVYALGVMLFELLTGRLPHELDKDRAIALGTIQEAAPLTLRQAARSEQSCASVGLVDITPELEAIVAKALRKSPEDRYQSAAAFADDVHRFLSGDAVSALVDNRRYLLRTALRKFRVHSFAIGAFAAIVAISLVSLAVLWQRSEAVAAIYRDGLMVGSYLQAGKAIRDEGRLDDALAMFEKAVELSNFLDSPDPRVLQHVQDANYRLGSLLVSIGRIEDARPHVAAAYRLAESMTQRFPSDDKWPYLLSTTRYLQARILSRDGDHEAALNELREAILVQQAYAERWPDKPTYAATLASSFGQQGSAFRRLKRMEDSFDSYLVAQRILRALEQAQPDLPEHQIELARIEGQLAVWHLTLKRRPHDQAAWHCVSRASARLTRLHETGRDRGLGGLLDEIRNPLTENRELVLRRLSRSAQDTHTY